MKTIVYDKKDGSSQSVDPVDAREIVNSNPERYTTSPVEVPKGKLQEPDITLPDLSAKLSDSGLPAGTEFTRRLTEDDQALLRNQQRLEGAVPRSQGLTANEIKDQLDAMGVPHKAGMSKQELAALLDAA